MHYWDGSKKFLQPRTGNSSVELTESLLSSSDFDLNPDLIDVLKSGPKRKLSLEQEFLLVLMKLRLGLMVEDLAFRFQISAGKVSHNFYYLDKVNV